MMPSSARHAFFVPPALLLAGEAGQGDPGEQDRASKDLAKRPGRTLLGKEI